MKIVLEHVQIMVHGPMKQIGAYVMMQVLLIRAV